MKIKKGKTKNSIKWDWTGKVPNKRFSHPYKPEDFDDIEEINLVIEKKKEEL
jgi:hypothetical protein